METTAKSPTKYLNSEPIFCASSRCEQLHMLVGLILAEGLDEAEDDFRVRGRELLLVSYGVKYKEITKEGVEGGFSLKR